MHPIIPTHHARAHRVVAERLSEGLPANLQANVHKVVKGARAVGAVRARDNAAQAAPEYGTHSSGPPRPLGTRHAIQQIPQELVRIVLSSEPEMRDYICGDVESGGAGD